MCINDTIRAYSIECFVKMKGYCGSVHFVLFRFVSQDGKLQEGFEEGCPPMWNIIYLKQCKGDPLLILMSV